MTLPNLGRLSLRAAAPTGVFAPIPQPPDGIDAQGNPVPPPEEEDTFFGETMPWNEWWRTFCVKAATSRDDEPVCNWFDARSLARYLHHALRADETPLNPLNKEPLDRRDVDELLAIYPVDPGDPDWVEAGAVDNGARTEPQVKKALVALWRLRAAEARRVRVAATRSIETVEQEVARANERAALTRVAGAAAAEAEERLAAAEERLATMGAADNDAPSIPTTAPTEPQPAQPVPAADDDDDMLPIPRPIDNDDYDYDDDDDEERLRTELDETEGQEEDFDAPLRRAEDFRQAILDEDVHGILTGLDRGFDANTTVVGGKTAMHVAAKLNYALLVVPLMQSGFRNVNARDQYENTPLHVAAMHNAADAGETIIRVGADVQPRNYLGETPLHQAAMLGHLAMIESLIVFGRADVEAINNANNNGFRPLHYAVDGGHPVTVERLLRRHHADPNATARFDCTPLHIACEKPLPSPDIVAALLAAGADATLGDEDANTPLHVVVLRVDTDERTAVVEALLAADPPADPSARNVDGETPIDLARRYRHDDLVNLLLRAAAPAAAAAARGAVVRPRSPSNNPNRRQLPRLHNGRGSEAAARDSAP